MTCPPVDPTRALVASNRDRQVPLGRAGVIGRVLLQFGFADPDCVAVVTPSDTSGVVLPHPKVIPIRPAPGGAAAETVQHVIEIARSELGRIDYSRDGAARGGAHLQQIIEETTGFRPTDVEIARTHIPHGTSWCGVFAMWVWAQAGIDVQWDLRRGQPTGELQKNWPWSRTGGQARYPRRRAFEDAIRVGDVIVGAGPRWHHEIVVGIDPANGALTTISGNTSWGRIVERTRADRSWITAFYRPT